MNKPEKPTIFSCDACGALSAQVVHYSKVFGHGTKMMVVEDVPYVKCSSCGTEYLTGETLDKLDQLRLKQSQLEHLSIPVARIS
jgi:YgiT-type zinc finger domain-containing protein